MKRIKQTPNLFNSLTHQKFDKIGSQIRWWSPWLLWVLWCVDSSTIFMPFPALPLLWDPRCLCSYFSSHHLIYLLCLSNCWSNQAFNFYTQLLIDELIVLCSIIKGAGLLCTSIQVIWHSACNYFLQSN